MNNVGFNHALRKVKNILLDVRNEYSKIFIIGFRVGATVAWLCSEEKDVDGIVGFYGSRIRDYINIFPNVQHCCFFRKLKIHLMLMNFSF